MLRICHEIIIFFKHFETNINELILNRNNTRRKVVRSYKMGEYKIKDIEILTGIKSHTIRIWEKRYGILKPLRTTTKIRTYSDQDLKEILNVAILNKNGWKISHIADFSLSERNEKVLSLQKEPTSEIYMEKLLLALLDMNETLFQDTLNFLIEKYGIEKWYAHYISVFLNQIGVMWIAGTIHPAQEHFISNMIRQKLIAATAGLVAPKENAKKIILFLPEDEWHELSLLFYNYLLRSKGFRTYYMGQNLPFDAVLDSVKQIQPAALVTSLISAKNEGEIISYFEKMKNAVHPIPIYAGGMQVVERKVELTKWVHTIANGTDFAAIYELQNQGK